MVNLKKITVVCALVAFVSLPNSVHGQQDFATYTSSPMLLLPLDAVSASAGVSAIASFNDRSPTAYGLRAAVAHRRLSLSIEGVAGRASGPSTTDANGWYSAGSAAATFSVAPELLFLIAAQADHETWSGSTRKSIPVGVQLALPVKLMDVTLTPIVLVGGAARFDNRESISSPGHEASDGTWRDGFFVGAAGRVSWRNIWVQAGWQRSKQLDGGLGAATPVIPIGGGDGFRPAPLQMATAAAIRIGYSMKP